MLGEERLSRGSWGWTPALLSTEVHSLFLECTLQTVLSSSIIHAWPQSLKQACGLPTIPSHHESHTTRSDICGCKLFSCFSSYYWAERIQLGPLVSKPPRASPNNCFTCVLTRPRCHMKRWILQHRRHDIFKSGRHTKNASQSIKTEEIHHFVYFPVQKELVSILNSHKMKTILF